jgi:hypothetical protein
LIAMDPNVTVDTNPQPGDGSSMLHQKCHIHLEMYTVSHVKSWWNSCLSDTTCIFCINWNDLFIHRLLEPRLQPKKPNQMGGNSWWEYGTLQAAKGKSMLHYLWWKPCCVVSCVTWGS